MKFSIITVSYNSSSLLEKTILSVINQTYRDYEYIIIDGGSTDDTKVIIEKYADYISYWVSEPDKGIYDAMNKAARIAKGDWLFFINCDDQFYNNAVLETVARLIVTPDTIYYGDAVMLPDGHIHGGAFSKKGLCRLNICHQTIFYPRIVFEKYSYNTNYKLYADWNLNIICMGDKTISFSYMNELISYYMLGGASYMHNDYAFEKDFYKIIRCNFGISYYIYLYYLHYKLKFIKLLFKMMGNHSLDNNWTIY